MLTTQNSYANQSHTLWEECLEQIERKISPHSFETWFKPIDLCFTPDGKPYIEVPNQFFADFIEEHFFDLIKTVLHDHDIDTTTIHFVSSDKEWEIERPVIEPPKAIEPLPVEKPAPKSTSFLREYTFNKYVVGDSNRFAFASCLAVAEAPGKTSFNPLTIYGGTGLGKTHLLQAIGHFAQQEGTADSIIYMTSQEFINQYMSFVRDKKDSTSFYKKFAEAELLLIDDIHFFSGKPSTQKEFYRIFNNLLLQNKQIVLSSDRPPEKIPDMMDHIINRFMGGLIADIQPPNLETRIAILKKKAEIDHVTLPQEVVEYIATQITSNVRELEGTLIRLIASASFTGKEITLAVAREIFGDVINRKNQRLTVDIIQQTVATHFGISHNQLRAHTRKREIAYPRTIAMYLCKKWTKQALRTIGLDFGGRDYSTVIHACKKIETDLDTDEQLQRDIETLDNLLKPLAS
ncbi:MAG: chromosomal replication initiator protein DnaA [Chitinivibrionales bacterium]|nr:chromosomal replication initiator protein DnaA [Chitinivibrionales bacterium]